MIGDARFRMPSLPPGFPPEIGDYLASVGNAIARAIQGLGQKVNDPQLIIVPTASGMRPLGEVTKESGARPGDLRATVASRAEATKWPGWKICDGRNGTPDSFDAFVIGSSEGDDGGASIAGGFGTSGPSPDDTALPVPDETDGLDDPDQMVLIIEGAEDGCVDNKATLVADSVHSHGMNEHVHDMSDHIHLLGGLLKSFGVIWMMKL